MDRRAALAEAALAYATEKGLIGLSLRPLARRLGTSDRMLIYHFGSKDELVADVVELANRRLADSLTMHDGTETVATAGDLVRHAWRRLTAADVDGTVGLYLEMCVLSARDRDRWASAQERIRGAWIALLRTELTALGIPGHRVPALADLVLDTVDGLLLDRIVRADPTRADAAAEAFAALLDRGALA